jgi:hypothetical protein
VQPTVRRLRFLNGHAPPTGGLPDVSWFNAQGEAVDWNGHDLALICMLGPPGPEEDPAGAGREVLLLINANPQTRDFTLPALAKSFSWRRFIDTAAAPPRDIYPDQRGPRLPRSRKLRLEARSLACYVSDRRV